MIRSTLKFPYIKDFCKIVTFFSTFCWAPLRAPGLAPGPGIVFYMLQAMYLDHTSDPEAPADVSGHLRRSGHRAVTSRPSSAGGARRELQARTSGLLVTARMAAMS